MSPPHRPTSIALPVMVAAVALAASLAAGARAEASVTKAKGRAKTAAATAPASKSKARGKSKARTSSRTSPKISGGKRGGAHAGVTTVESSSTFPFHRPANVVPNQHGKVVVFPFRDDDDDRVSTQVGQLLEARGIEVVTGVRRVDSAEQYRDVATQLELVGYVDGDLRGGDQRTRATIRLRSGYSGRNVSQATFTESRADLPRRLSDDLWKKLGPALARACADAEKPRRSSRTTLRINAGVPLETAPADPFADETAQR